MPIRIVQLQNGEQWNALVHNSLYVSLHYHWFQKVPGIVLLTPLDHKEQHRLARAGNTGVAVAP